MSHQLTKHNEDVGIYEHNGRSYLAHRCPSGQVTFIPIDAIAQQFPPPPITPSPIPPPLSQPAPQHDPLAIFLAGLGILLIVLGGYFLGFVAGKNGQSVVVVPRSPVCETRRSSFLFWNNEHKECQ